MLKDNESELGDQSEKNPKKGIMLTKLLSFYTRMETIFKKFKNDIKVIEVNPKVENLDEDNYSFDYINFIVNVGINEYLVFLKVGQPGYLPDQDLDLFFQIFLLYPEKIGIIIVWNDSELNSIKLTSRDLHAEKEKVKQFILENRIPLDILIKNQIILPVKKSNLSEKFPRKRISGLMNVDFVREFEEKLKKVYFKKNESKDKSIIREVLNEINVDDLRLMKHIFSEYLSTDITQKELKKKILNRFKE